MANTYTQLYVQIVFAVEGRQFLIACERKEELQKYITGIVSGCGQKLIAIHCMPDHTHLFIGQKPSIALSDLVHEVKSSSTKFINGKRWVLGRFGWQEGFGAFSYSHSQIPAVARYIERQEEHHRRKTFRDEYLDLLKRFQVAHEERYVFKNVM
jgi:putative transposase